jgi:hypothetical protein
MTSGKDCSWSLDSRAGRDAFMRSTTCCGSIDSPYTAASGCYTLSLPLSSTGVNTALAVLDKYVEEGSRSGPRGTHGQYLDPLPSGTPRGR